MGSASAAKLSPRYAQDSSAPLRRTVRPAGPTCSSAARRRMTARLPTIFSAWLAGAEEEPVPRDGLEGTVTASIVPSSSHLLIGSRLLVQLEATSTSDSVPASKRGEAYPLRGPQDGVCQKTLSSCS